MSKSHVTVVGAVPEGPSRQRSYTNLRFSLFVQRHSSCRYFPQKILRSCHIPREKIPLDMGLQSDFKRKTEFSLHAGERFKDKISNAAKG